MDLLDYTMVGLSVIALIMAVANGFVRRVSRANRVVPIFLQLGLLGLMFMPLLHGFPTEWFQLLVLTIVWSLCAFASSFMLYRSPVKISRFLGTTQFAEGAAALFGTAAGYVGSCYAYYGHFVWAP
jgi:hypothetical protein